MWGRWSDWRGDVGVIGVEALEQLAWEHCLKVVQGQGWGVEMYSCVMGH